MRGLAVLADERERAGHRDEQSLGVHVAGLDGAESIVPASMSFICWRCLSRLARSITGGQIACWNSFSL